jgi:hypothetical protein
MFQNIMHNVPNVTKCNNVTVCNVQKHNLQMLQNATVWMSESTNHNLWRLTKCKQFVRWNAQAQSTYVTKCKQVVHSNAQCTMLSQSWLRLKVCESCALQLNSWTISIMFVNCKSPKNYWRSLPQSSKTSWLSEWIEGRKSLDIWLSGFIIALT